VFDILSLLLKKMFRSAWDPNNDLKEKEMKNFLWRKSP